MGDDQQPRRAPRAKRQWEILPFEDELGRFHIPEDEWEESCQLMALAGKFLGGGFTVMPVRVRLQDGSYQCRGMTLTWENVRAVSEDEWTAWYQAKMRARMGAQQNGQPPAESDDDDFLGEEPEGPTLEVPEPEPVTSGD